MKKRILSAFMALALCLTLLPTAAFAEGADGGAASRETITVEGGQPTATGAPTEGGGQLTNTGEGEQPNSETDMRTEICCVGKPDSIGRSYDGTTDGGTIPIDLTFTDGTNEIKLKEGTGFTAKKTFDSADAGWHTVTVEIALIGEAAVKYKLKAGEEKFKIGGNINKAYPKLTVSLSQTTCTVGEKILPLLSVSGVQENAAVTYYYAPVNSGYLEFEGSETVPAIDENTAISEPGTYYVYAKTGETTNYKEERSATVALTVTEPAAASVSKADGTVSGTYKTLPAALNAAQDGDTVKLLADYETVEGAGEEEESGLTITKSVTLDLNGHTVDKLTVGDNTSSGSLTVRDSGENGSVTGAVSLVSGTLTVAGGTVQSLSGNGGTATITGGSVKGADLSSVSCTVTGGSGHCGTWQAGSAAVTVTGGAFGDVTFANPSNVQLTGGSFEKIAVSGASAGSLSALLANGYAFYSTSGAYQSAEGTELSNVQVQRHTHSINADGKCTECGAAFAASVTVRGGDASDASYYDTIDSAFTAAHKGDTVTLLADITNRGGSIFVSGGPYTLDLNGHRIDASGIDLVVGDVDNSEVLLRGELTVKDSSTNNAGYVQYLKLWNGDLTVESGSFHWIIESRSDSVGTITITGGTAETVTHCSPNVTFRLSGGTFDRITISSTCGENVFPSDLLADGYAYANKISGAIQNGEGYSDVSDVTVVKHDHTWNDGVCACGREHTDHTWEDGKCTVCHLTCSHHEIGEDGMCQTCGTQFTAKANGTYYKRLADALADQNVDDVTLVADDTLSADVTLVRDIRFFPNGHTVSGGGSIVVPSGERLGLDGTGNAGAIRVKDGGTLVVDEGFTGTVQTLTVSEHAKVTLCGGTYGTITGLRQKAGTLLNYNTVTGEKYFAFQKKDGTFARYDQRIPSETPLENVTVAFCRHEQLTEACGETCEYCDGALRCRIGASGYRNMSDAIRDVPDGGTITLLRDYSAVTNISANVDRAYTIDLNGHSVQRNSGGISLAVYAGTPKIVDSKGGGVIAGLEIDSKLGLTLADLLPEGWDFQKSDGSWLSTTELKGKTASNVTVVQLPIQSMKYPTEMSMTYGGTGTLIVNVKGTGAVTFQWYKVENGNETAVGDATTKSQFDLSAQKLPAGNHTFRFSATCDGYEKMSKDIAVTVQRADIRSNLITPPTAQENLTYTGHEQALITAGSVTSGGTMQYSLTENGTYGQNIPVGTDAGTYTVWYRVIGDANHNDTAPASVAVSIGKKLLTITGVKAASKPYDGTTNADISSVTFDNVTLNPGTDYTVTASFDDAGVGSGKSITATVTLLGQAAKNYALEQSSFPTTASITKAAAPDFTKETALVIVNGHEKTYTVTLPALPTLETPKEYGAPTYELGEIKLNDGYYTSGAKVENGALTLPIQKNDVETTGPVGTVSVVIKSANYEDITLTVNVNATNKLVPTVTAPTANALTYNGAEQALVTAGKTTGGTMLYRLGDSEWSEQLPTAKNAGKYTVWYKVQGDAEYADVAEQSLTVTAAKKAVTVTALDKSAHTGSTAPDLSSPEADKNYKVEGLLGADTLSGTVTLTYEQTPDMNKPGKTAINITGTLSNDNYKITYVHGTLTVSDRPSSGGGGSSSDRDTSSSGTVKTDTVTNPDGSVTKTETKKDGTKVETTTGKDGSTVKTTTNPNGSSVTETKAADGSTGTVRTDKNGQTTAETTLSSKAIEDAKKSGEPVKAPVEVKASRDSSTAPTVKVDLPKNSGDTKVEIPVSNVKPGTVAVLVHADGTEEIVKNSLPTEDGIQLTVDGGATVKIVDNSKDFIDTRNHWAKDAIDFVSARGLVNGMNDFTYAPNNSTTRAQLWTILARQNDADLNGGSVWYEKAQLWSKDKGISDGTEPNAAINRAQMVTMLWRTMGQPAAGGAATFTDVPADSYYAQAVAWAVENGITTGVGGGRFDPSATCTRAQIAVFLYRYMK